MLPVVQIVAVIATALFAGAALYINSVEHPARMSLDTAAAASQWAPSYKRATLMQAPLALIGLIAGVVAWLMGAGAGWLVAAILIGSVVPFTLLVIMPTNNQLLDPARDTTTSETRHVLERWSRLHAVRTALSLVATVLFVGLLTACV